MTLRSLLPALLVSVVLLATSLPSFAQESGTEYDEQTIAEVNQHFSTGAKLYNSGDYDGAISEFEAAHAKIPNAIFLYNISLALAKKGEREKSLDYAQRAESLGGLSPEDSAQNRARMTALDRVGHAEKATKTMWRKPVDPLFHFSTLGWVGSGLVVGGLVGLGAVLAMDGGLASDVDAHRAAVERNDLAAAQRLEDDLRPRQNGARVLFVMSTAAFVAGSGLIVYDLFIRDDDSKVSAAFHPGGAGVVLTHHF